MDKPIILAAGGLVWNENEELLMIYRMGKWDLPKGKLDDGETIQDCAVREVMEETGIGNISIGPLIGITQHEYFDKYLNQEVVKESHWYFMSANGNQKLVPQIDEYIEDIKWAGKNEIRMFLQNSYANIENIIKQYFAKFKGQELILN